MDVKQARLGDFFNTASRYLFITANLNFEVYLWYVLQRLILIITIIMRYGNEKSAYHLWYTSKLPNIVILP